jgi:UDP-N-acetylglucosamine--N-acetylmuramyl-(pentapeptide) pyrophosphoryl-undecaprenol N-acetylglucosamine transferase
MLTLTIIIAAGGTGGHVFPALAVAEALRHDGHTVYWLGNPEAMEGEIAKKHGFTLLPMRAKGLRGKGVLEKIKALWAFWQALRLCQKQFAVLEPDAVLGFGGFVSAAAGFAAVFKALPLYIHEQNALPGFTNRLLSRFARHTFTGFPEVLQKESRGRALYVGNPVRAALWQVPPLAADTDPARPLRLLVIGGSLGAQALNTLVPHALALLPPEKRPQVLHQAGNKHVAEAVALYQEQQLEAKVLSFIDDMAAAYAWADFVICRAGALTIAELLVVGRPALLIPFPFAVDDHQFVNAQFLVTAQGAYCWRQETATAERLAAFLSTLTLEKCQAMALHLHALPKPDSVSQMLRELYAPFLPLTTEAA